MRTYQLVVLFTLICLSCDSVENKNDQKEEPKDNDGPVVVYNLSGTEDVIVKMDIPFQEHGDSNLEMDIYYPPNFNFKSKIPAIVIIFGYSDEAQNKIIGKQFRKWSWYTSWCRIIAASGMAAIVYETIDPVYDLNALEDFLIKNESETFIDKNKIGVFAVSANTPTAISKLLATENNIFRCGAFYYGLILTRNSEYLNQWDSISNEMGFVIPELDEKTSWNKEIPIMLIMAGMDKFPNLNASMQEFYDVATNENLIIELTNFSSGVHGFDAFNDNDTTRMIIENTLEFWKSNLLNSNSN